MAFEQKIKDIQKLAHELNSEPSLSEVQRKQLLHVLQEEVHKTQTPAEWLWRMMLTPHEYAALRVALELDLAGLVSKQGQCTATQLASSTKADRVLIARIMRILVPLGVFAETGPETYTSGKISSYLDKDRNLGDGMKFMWDTGARAVARLPEYLVETNYQNPSGKPGIFELAFGPDQNVFTWVGTHPASLQHFQNLMAVQRFTRVNWFDIFPVKERLLDGFDSSVGQTLIVDVGGGRGSELEAFKEKFPNAPGQLVLQDVPEVIDSCPHLDEMGISRQKHDFFTTQPVKGARAYYLRSILHDWPEDKCLSILENLKPAMKKGYSKILINDWVLPDTGATLYPATLDLHMMALFNSMERSRSQFEAMIKSAGLQIVKIYSAPDTESVVEVMLQE